MATQETNLTNELGELLRRARIERALTQEQLAGLIGCSKSHLSQMEGGLRTVSVERAAAIECAVGITDASLINAVRWHQTPPQFRQRMCETEHREKQLVAHLRRALHSEAPLDALRKLIETSRANVDEPLPLTRSIPLINNIAAGVPAEFTDLDYPAAVADAYIACPDVTDPDAFAARVVGDSMEPVYRESEIVVFSPALDTPSGSDCFVRLVRDNETTFKRIYHEDDDRTIRLQPLNPQYPPRLVDREDVAGMYAAMYVMRRV